SGSSSRSFLGSSPSQATVSLRTTGPLRPPGWPLRTSSLAASPRRAASSSSSERHAVERATGIGGVFVRSPQPDALRAWYAEHLGLELQAFGGAVLTPSGGETLTWAVFAGDTDYFGSREQQVMVNYRVRDLDAM